MQLRKYLRVVTPTLIIVSLLTAIFLPLVFSSKTNTASGEGDETTYYLLNDHLGSIDVVLDESGEVVERRDYLPYGAERLSESEPNGMETDYGFTGKELDDETGLNYYEARYYDSEIGRFVAMDPLLMGLDTMNQAERNAFLSNPQNLNAYTYVNNNPLKYTDPTGMYGKDVHYDLTLRLADMANLTSRQVRTVTYRDQYMDENPATTPFSIKHPFKSYGNLKSGVTEYYHFASREEAIRRLNLALDNKSSTEFGDALHTFQDTYSHAGLTPDEHKDLGKAPDQTYLDQGKALEMAKQSFLYLRRLNRATNGLGEMTPAEYRRQTVEIWNNNKDEIAEYLWTKDKEGTTIEANARRAEEN